MEARKNRKRKGKIGNFYPCSQQACGYSISQFYKINDSDIERLLSGKYSSTKNLKRKDGRQYKAKFILENAVLKREFLNKKK